MTTPPPTRAPQKPAKPAPARQLAAATVPYLMLIGIPAALWYTAGDPIVATTAYATPEQLQLLWNTLLTDPAGDEPAFVQAAIDLLWLAWAPFGLAGTVLLLATLLRVPRTAIPRFLLRLTPTAVIQSSALGAAALAHAHTGAVHAGALHHHDHARLELSQLDARPDGVLRAIDRNGQSGSERTVEPGDSLWTIAEQEYGHSSDWRAIFTANQHRTQPDGEALTDPDVIQPGWILTIPSATSEAAPPNAAADHAPPTTAGTDPHPPVGPAKPATTGNAAPGTPTPATTKHNSIPYAGNRPVRPPTPPASNTAAPDRHIVPRPRTDRPWTTRIELPEGGYVGVTMVMAIAGCAAALRRRARRSGHADNMPAAARHLAIAASRAEMASTGDWDPELETDPTPPPLLRPRPEQLIFGTTPAGTDEAVLDPQRHPLTAYTGPGAHQAAAALALSALSSEPPHRLITTTALAQALLGIDTESPDPAWLNLTPDTPAALRTAADDTETRKQTATVVIADAATTGTFQLTTALAADRGHNRLAVLLLGDTKHLIALSPTTIEIDKTGQPRKTSGPQAAAFHGTRFHTLPPATATELYHVLRHQRTTATTHPHTQDRHEHRTQSASHLTEPVLTDDEHHQAPYAATAESTETSQPQPPDVPTQSPTVSNPSATTIAADTIPLLLRVLGPLTYENATGQAKPGPTGRNAQLLTYLAVHPRGRTLQQITAAIWNSTNPSGANSTLVRVRKDLQRAIIELGPELSSSGDEDLQPIILEPHGVYHLNHRLITADLAAFERLEVLARREMDPARRAELTTQALSILRGELAEGVPEKDQDWLVERRVDLNLRESALIEADQASLASTAAKLAA